MSTKTILIRKNKKNNKNSKKNEILSEILASKDKIKEIINSRKEYLKSVGYLDTLIRKNDNNSSKLCIDETKSTPKKDSSNYNTVNIRLGKSRSQKRVEKSVKNRKSKHNKASNSNNNNNTYNYYKKTRKFNPNEIKFIIKTLKRLVDENNYNKINVHLKKTTRCQVIQILSKYNIIRRNTKAPTPLIKNILFNFILGNIIILVK